MLKIKNFSKKEKSSRIPPFEDKIFNSSLYIDLDSTSEESINDSNEEKSENVDRIDDNIKVESFLIKDLIDELDSPELDMIKFNNSLNNNKTDKTATALTNNGYKFIPKKYRNDVNNNCNDKNTIKNWEKSSNNSKNGKFKAKNKIKKKDDWICNFCLNLNFSFRKKCNRCKAPKINRPIKNGGI